VGAQRSSPRSCCCSRSRRPIRPADPRLGVRPFRRSPVRPRQVATSASWAPGRTAAASGSTTANATAGWVPT
jgi:hypothetical protein